MNPCCNIKPNLAFYHYGCITAISNLQNQVTVHRTTMEEEHHRQVLHPNRLKKLSKYIVQSSQSLVIILQELGRESGIKQRATKALPILPL